MGISICPPFAIQISPRTHTQIKKGVAPAFEISPAKSETQFPKFSEAGRRATSWGHVHCSSMRRWFRTEAEDRAGALQTNREEVGKRVCSSPRHGMNPWPGLTTPVWTPQMRSTVTLELSIQHTCISTHTKQHTLALNIRL